MKIQVVWDVSQWVKVHNAFAFRVEQSKMNRCMKKVNVIYVCMLDAGNRWL
jgi:hypothetical protein